MTHFVVSPAYGRDYKNSTEVLKAWQEGKDFVHESRLFTGGGMYISNRDISPGDTIEVRYRNKRCVMMINAGQLVRRSE